MKTIWQVESAAPRPPLEGQINADVCVIGAGVAGLNCAYLLKEAGLNAVVLEAGRVGAGTTSRTTGKVTAQHDLIYDFLSRTSGGEAARAYAEINQTALETYARVVRDEGIDCDFVRADSFVFARGDATSLENERKAMERAGLDAYLTEESELPFPVTASLGLRNQAHFHPMKYLNALARLVPVYENSRALDVEEKIVRTARGSVRADRVVVATRFPFLNAPGYYFLRMHQEMSCILALEGPRPLSGMHIDRADGGLSLRPWRNLTLVCSGSWRTGENAGSQYAELERKAAEMFPGARPGARWSAEDCVTQDRLPFVGPYGAHTQDMYVATGFGKWGMSLSMAAALILTELIQGRESAAARLFSPRRAPTHGMKALGDDMIASVKGFARHLKLPEDALPDVPAGEARVVELSGHKVGAYRDPDGKIHAVPLTCPHLGCLLSWNPDDLSWDCPCHGSRFDVDGNLLDGPAQDNLPPL